MVLASPISATSIPVIILSFYQRYATEAGFDFCNVEVSGDNGTTWQAVANYSGTLSTWTPQSFDITDYAGGFSQFKIRFRLTSDASATADGWYVDNIRVLGYSSSPTGVKADENKLPSSFALHQNFPNPFNPSTQISFAVPVEAQVQLEIYNVLGERVATLVNETRPAGFYTEQFDARNLTSGVYFYRLHSGGFVQTRKLLLLR
jgi:hypothetical protein